MKTHAFVFATLATSLFAGIASARTSESNIVTDWIGKSGFGAGYELGTSTLAFDHDTECARRKAENPCANLVDIPALQVICLSVRQQAIDEICAVSGSEYEARIWASVSGEVMGKGKRQLARAEGYATAKPTLNKAGFTLTVAGQKLYDPSFSTSASVGFAYPVEFLSATKTYMIGPVPVLLTAELVGSLGVTVSGKFGTSTVTLGAEPYVSVDAALGAGVGCKMASAGVEGSLELVKVSVPATAAITFNGDRTFDWKLDLDLVVSGLSGEIALVAKLMGETVGSLTIFDWKGFEWSDDLAEASGTSSY